MRSSGGVADPARAAGDVGEGSVLRVEVGEPSVEMVGGDEVVARGEVAVVGEDDVLDGVVGGIGTVEGFWHLVQGEQAR
jgi:hypothetical protein